MELRQSTKLDKLQLTNLSFSKTDVLSDNTDRFIRNFELNRALRLGNTYKQSVRIYFINALGEHMETEGTVWAVTEKYVMLKGGNTIPIRAIRKVDL
jgi:hypothetical protein